MTARILKNTLFSLYMNFLKQKKFFSLKNISAHQICHYLTIFDDIIKIYLNLNLKVKLKKLQKNLTTINITSSINDTPKEKAPSIKCYYCRINFHLFYVYRI